LGSLKAKKLGLTIRQARKNAELTQEGIAAKIKISSRTYQAYELGAVLPRYETLFKIAKVTGTTAPQLLKPMWDDWKGKG